MLNHNRKSVSRPEYRGSSRHYAEKKRLYGEQPIYNFMGYVIVFSIENSL